MRFLGFGPPALWFPFCRTRLLPGSAYLTLWLHQGHAWLSRDPGNRLFLLLKDSSKAFRQGSLSQGDLAGHDGPARGQAPWHARFFCFAFLFFPLSHRTARVLGPDGLAACCRRGLVLQWIPQEIRISHPFCRVLPTEGAMQQGISCCVCFALFCLATSPNLSWVGLDLDGFWWAPRPTQRTEIGTRKFIREPLERMDCHKRWLKLKPGFVFQFSDGEQWTPYWKMQSLQGSKGKGTSRHFGFPSFGFVGRCPLKIEPLLGALEV